MMNWPTIVTASVVAIICIAIIVNGIRKKKKGESSCGGCCCGCTFSESCHSKK